MSTHKCRHCGEDIRSVRLWLPRPPDWPGGILTPPPWETAYESLEDGDRFCRGVDTWTWNRGPRAVRGPTAAPADAQDQDLTGAIL